MSVQVPRHGRHRVETSRAVAVAKKYSLLPGCAARVAGADQRCCARHPENRLRIYDVRSVIDTRAMRLVLGIRRAFGPGMVTALGRIEAAVRHRATSPCIWPAPSTPTLGQGARFRKLCDASTCRAVPVRYTRLRWGGGREDGLVRTALACRDGAELERAFQHHRAAQGLRAGRQAMAGVVHAGNFASPWRPGEVGGMGWRAR